MKKLLILALLALHAFAQTDFAPHNMTSDSAPSPYVASASSTYQDACCGPWRAFDGTAGIGGYGWIGSGNGTDWLQIDTGSVNLYALSSYAIYGPDTAELARAPKNFTLQGSNDNSTWTVIDTETNQTAWTNYQTRTYTLGSSSARYRYFQLNITANNGDATYTDVIELYFYGTRVPVCNAGAQQSFRVGYAGTLDGSASTGTGITYAWTKLSGPSVVWTSQNTATPGVTASAFGSYVFQLEVTDTSSNTATCTVKDGAVVTGNNNIVITGLRNVDLLLGPMVRYGANPWPWYDNRHKTSADLQNAVMDTYFPDWWDAAAPGTVTVSTSQQCGSSAAGACVVGSGTTFTTTFCQGPGSPTVPQTYYTMIAIWHTQGVVSGTGREMNQVSSCIDDTHLILGSPYSVSYVSGNPWISLDGSGLSYSADVSGAAVRWGWGNGSASPGNYYDNVSAYYALYYRSGIDDYLTAARKLADRFWSSPMIDQGLLPGGWTYSAFRQMSVLGLVLRALDSPPANMWPGLESVFNFAAWYLANYDLTQGLYDEREVAYQLKALSYGAIFDPTFKATYQAAISASFAAYWTPTKFTASSNDFYWPQLFVEDASWYSGGCCSVTLANGSTTVTGVGTSWASSSFPTRIWFFPSTTWVPANDAAGDPVSYAVTFVSSTQLTLDSPYQGTTGSHGYEITNASLHPLTGWGTEPFMEGIQAEAFDWAAKAIATSDPTTSALAHSYNVGAANYLRDYGYWPLMKGLYYFTGGIECQPPISDSNGFCTLGIPADQSRGLVPEALRGVAAAYDYNHDPTLKTLGDTLYNAMFAKPGTCPTGSTACVPDQTYIDPLDDGQYMMNTPAVGSLGSATPWKWFGMFFGVSVEFSWPGYRVGGLQPGAGELLYIGATLPGVLGAATIRVVTTSPSGVTYTTNCNASPCAVTVDHRQSDHLVSIQYLSATGAVLASSSLPLVGGQ
jgi:hypothetical protein